MLSYANTVNGSWLRPVRNVASFATNEVVFISSGIFTFIRHGAITVALHALLNPNTRIS